MRSDAYNIRGGSNITFGRRWGVREKFPKKNDLYRTKHYQKPPFGTGRGSGNFFGQNIERNI